ncbi:hypothetical protein POM88_002212 [Heracleum sosnowskyi]|uniref:TF-B3 domain-containing protein n=1 Tax=Heracleum sosnowskyi TaxID=360622 RepID=A0AAD8JDY7_9APIA|nr:hypothetical protein POM88_002212 [Heracleum sosnowskyi]
MESMKSKKISAFFKPFIAEDREQRLPIPHFFTKFMKDRMPRSAFIRDRKENLWHVEVSRRENKNFFEAGWSKFVQEKKVQFGDCLVFEYDGESFFDVEIFGDTACEKEFSVEVFEAQVKEEEMEEEEDEDNENHEDEDGEGEEMKEEDEQDENYSAEIHEDGYSEDDHDEIVELRDANERMQSNKKDKNCTGEKGNNTKSTDDLADEIIFDLGTVDRPKNPYFVGKLDPKRKSDLRIPTNVIWDFKLNLPEHIDICDEDGRTWSAVVKKWNDGRTCLTKGWRSFWKWNGVEPNDKCLCEFVPGNDGSKIQLRIRIFQAASLLQ